MTIYKAGDVVLCGKTPGFTKRVADVVASSFADGGEVVEIIPRGAHNKAGIVAVWFASDLRPAPLRHWSRA